MNAYQHDVALAKAIDRIEEMLKHPNADCVCYSLSTDERQLGIEKDIVWFYQKIGHRCKFYGNSVMIEAHN